MYGLRIFDKDSRSFNGGKDNVFNKGCRENWTVTYRRMKLYIYLTPYTKINSKNGSKT